MLNSAAATPENLAPIVQRIGPLHVGIKSNDSDVQKYFGQGCYVENEGHGGGRYFTNKARTITLHTEIGVDGITDTIELSKGLHVPDACEKNINVFSQLLEDPLKIDYNITLGMSAEKLIRLLGKPHIDKTKGKQRIITYQTDFETDNRVSLSYSAEYFFLRNRLTKISLYDGE